MRSYLDSDEAWRDFCVWLGTQPVPDYSGSRLSFGDPMREYWYAWLDTPDRQGGERCWKAMQR